LIRLKFKIILKIVKADWFYHASTNYKFKNGGSFEDLCDYNGKVASQYGKFEIYKNWMIMKTIYKENEKYEPVAATASHDPKSNLSPASSKQVLNVTQKFCQS
jgi:hypothetical protein